MNPNWRQALTVRPHQMTAKQTVNRKNAAKWSGRRESNLHGQLGRLVPNSSRLPTFGGHDQEIYDLDPAARALWVEIWVENRRCLKSVETGAGYCCCVILREISGRLTRTRFRSGLVASAARYEEGTAASRAKASWTLTASARQAELVRGAWSSRVGNLHAYPPYARQPRCRTRSPGATPNRTNYVRPRTWPNRRAMYGICRCGSRNPRTVTVGVRGFRFGGGGRRSPPGHAVLQGEFGEDASDAGLDSLLADRQVPGDLPVAAAAGDQPEYVAFARVRAGPVMRTGGAPG